jgi:hypothetical protein
LTTVVAIDMPLEAAAVARTAPPIITRVAGLAFAHLLEVLPPTLSLVQKRLRDSLGISLYSHEKPSFL